MIAVIDYQAGNLTSVAQALNHIGQSAAITSDPAVIIAAERIIFPGVGAAKTAMCHLAELGLVTVLRDCIAQGKPFLGICLGYQILFDSSEEDDQTPCLGLLPGLVVRFDDTQIDTLTGRPLKIPHMGWNRFAGTRPHPVLEGVSQESEFYFVHSYYPIPEPSDVLGVTEYGTVFASGVSRGALIAFQFHPEKSGAPGLKIMDNFCHWSGVPC